MTTSDPMEYAANYQAKRLTRCKATKGAFPPLEALRCNETGQLHLSVSFSGTSHMDLYLSRSVSLYRATKVTRRLLIVPTGTVSCVLTVLGMQTNFDGLLEDAEIDGEVFWMIRGDQHTEVKRRIAKLPLSNAFRHDYQHTYLPDSA